MANVEKNPRYRDGHGYSPFDLSRDYAGSTPLSMLVPLFTDFLNPGDKIKFSTTMFTRTEPLVKPALVRVHEHVDWFFVPMEQLYSAFGSVFYGIQDINTSLMTVENVSQYFPCIDLKVLFNMMFQYEIGATLQDEESQDLSDWAKQRDAMNVPHFHSVSRLLQSLGLTTQLLQAKDHYVSDVPEECTAYQPTAFFLAAYQKIFMDHYRLDNWEAQDPNYYNLDKFYDNPSVDKVATLQKLLTVHYAPLNKDYFTNVLPSPLVGAGSVSMLANGLNSGQIDIKNWQQPAGSQLLQLIGVDSILHQENNSNPSGVQPINSDGTGGFQNKTTPANLRGMFALEKLLEVTRRAGKHYDKQTLAHFGVNVPRGIAGEVYYLGSDDNEIDFNEVVSQANTVGEDSGSALGALAGKGIGASRNPVKDFEAPCHGIIMAIHYQKADTYYSLDTHFDKLNVMSESADLFHTEFDNLGPQPVFGYEQDFAPFGLLAGDPVDAWNNTLTAWQWRYMQYKTKYDVVGGKLLYGENKSWIPTRNWGFYTQNKDRYYQNPQFLDGIFEVNFNAPSISYDDPEGTWSQRDPFIHYMRFNYYKSSKMETYSLPKLNA